MGLLAGFIFGSASAQITHASERADSYSAGWDACLAEQKQMYHRIPKVSGVPSEEESIQEGHVQADPWED